MTSVIQEGHDHEVAAVDGEELDDVVPVDIGGARPDHHVRTGNDEVHAAGGPVQGRDLGLSAPAQRLVGEDDIRTVALVDAAVQVVVRELNDEVVRLRSGAQA